MGIINKFALICALTKFPVYCGCVVVSLVGLMQEAFFPASGSIHLGMRQSLPISTGTLRASQKAICQFGGI